MKISLRWIADYLELQDYYSKPNELGDILTRGGLEVEDLQNPAAQGLAHVVVGHILEKDKHPNADKLSLCRVSIGDGKVEQIVCGAQNHKAGDRVIVALPGAVLPGNFAIKKSTIRGIESNGMLCSLKELGLAQTSDGIVILSADAPVGVSYVEYAGLNDVIFELKVTPNRADCLSHFGLARELSALLARPLKPMSIEPKLVAESTLKAIQVEVKTPDLCARYTGRVIRNVKVGPSPDWLKQRLQKVGLASINNIVDALNYVMMELGQPLHAFDFDRIQGGKLIIDRAKAQEKFVTLDGSTLTLKGDELTIRDSEKALCIAGTIGGQNSGVSDSTTQIFIESAFFLPMSVRKTSRTHGIESDSAYRFSRGVDPQGTRLALDRATQLVLQLAGGEALSDAYDLSSNIPERSWISISAQLIEARMGYPVSAEKAVDYFKRLGCEIKLPTGPLSETSTLQVKAPSYRFDIEQQMDLVEEYARMAGYELIPETIPAFFGTPSIHDPVYLLRQNIGKALRSSSYSEAWNFAFVSEPKEAQFLGTRSRLASAGLETSTEKIKIMNPLNEELGVMRSTLTWGLMQNVLANVHRGNATGRLFETGTVFVKSAANYIEKQRLALVAWGYPQSLWDQKQRYPLAFELKSALEQVLMQLGIQNFRWNNGNPEEAPDFLHAGQWATLTIENEKVGFIGTVHPEILDSEKIREPLAIAEIELASLLKMPKDKTRFVLPISKFQSVTRDFAFVMPAHLAADKVAQAMRKAAGPLCIGIEIFDVYQGEELAKGFRSVALSMKLQDINGTLQDNVIQEVQSRVLEAVQQQFTLSPRTL